MMGADFYETEQEITEMLKEGKVPIGVGENSRVSNCIIDKNARIGKNVVIANTDVSSHFKHFHILFPQLCQVFICSVYMSQVMFQKWGTI